MEEIRTLRPNEIHVGDVVWAFGYRPAKKGRAMALKQPPVRGLIIEKEDGYRKLRYFVPYNEKGNLLNSKAVLVESRTYTCSEEDAKILYNRRVQSYVNQIQKQLDTAKSDFV